MLFTVFASLGSKYKSRIEMCVRPARIPDTSQVPESASCVVSPGKLIKCGETQQKKASYIHDSYLYLTLKHNRYPVQCYRGEKEVVEYQKGLV